MDKVMACVDGTASVDSVMDCAAWAAGRLGASLEFPLPARAHGPDRRRATATAVDHPARRAGDGTAFDAPPAQNEAERNARRSQGPYGRLFAALQDRPELQIRLVVLGKPGGAPETGPSAAEPDLAEMIAALQQPALVASRNFKPPRRFAVAFDGSAAGRRVIEAVIQSPLLKRLPCTVLMVGDRSAEVDRALGWAHRALSSAGFQVQAAATVGCVARALPMLLSAQHGDLLVIGANGSSGWRPFTLGSTATALLHSSPVSLLVMR